eukprot:11785483-Alexandrium_andersonii.AAC.2
MGPVAMVMMRLRWRWRMRCSKVHPALPAAAHRPVGVAVEVRATRGSQAVGEDRRQPDMLPGDLGEAEER